MHAFWSVLLRCDLKLSFSWMTERMTHLGMFILNQYKILGILCNYEIHSYCYTL